MGSPTDPMILRLRRVLSDEIVTECLQGANSGWRGEKCIDLVFIDDLPTSAAIGISWYTLEHDGCCAVG